LDFAWTDEQLDFRKEVIRFAKSEFPDDMIERDHNEQFSREGWDKCAKFGIHGLPIPAEYGGGAADTLTTVCALEALGYGCRDNGLIFSINAHMWSSEIPIWSFGTDAQKKKYLPKLTSGEWVGVHAMTEPMTGSDAFSLTTRAERKGDKVILNGWGLGETHLGAYAQKARVKGDWLVRLPEGMSTRDAMAIGTAGYTAMLAVLALGAFTTLGNFAAFFEIAAAARLDYTRQRIYLLPFLVLGFAVSIFSVSRACVSQMLAPITGAKFHWDKTQRFRTSR